MSPSERLDCLKAYCSGEKGGGCFSHLDNTSNYQDIRLGEESIILFLIPNKRQEGLVKKCSVGPLLQLFPRTAASRQALTAFYSAAADTLPLTPQLHVSASPFVLQG